MKSIRQRISLTLLVSLTVILAVGGSGIYFFTRALLLRDFDRVLHSMVNDVTGAVRSRIWERFSAGNELEFELNEAWMKSGLFVEAWTSDGVVLGRALSPYKIHLPFPPRLEKQPRYQNHTLTNGLKVRALVVASDLHIEEREPHFSPETAQGPGEHQKRMEIENRLRGLPRSMVIMIARDRSELDSTLRRLSLVLWTSGALMVLLTTIAVTWASRSGLALLQEVGEQAAGIDASRLHFRFPTRELPLELASICERLNDLLARLEASFAREKCFSENAAHELRTPIAELRTIAEVAVKWPSSDSTMTDAFRDTLDAALQMQRIVDGLLAIARCETNTQVVAREPVDVSELIRTIAEPFVQSAGNKQVSWEMEWPEGVFMETDRSMLGLILTNLFSNAVEYTPAGGWILIHLEKSEPMDLTVTNSVEGLTPEDLTHFCERFWRKDQARSSSEHSGIGLSVSQVYAATLGLNLTPQLFENSLRMRLCPL